LQNYNNYTLPGKNELFSYEAHKLCQLEYINMHVELKNIYRAFLATKILTLPENIELLFKNQKPPIDLCELMDKIIDITKDALKKSSYANIEHFLEILYTLIKLDLKFALKNMRKHNILYRCGEVIENPVVQKFVIFLLLHIACEPEQEIPFIQECIKSGIFKIMCNAVSINRKPPEIEVDSLQKTGYESPEMLQAVASVTLTASEMSVTENAAICSLDLLYILSTAFMDCTNQILNEDFCHKCNKHDLFLDYFFGGDCMLLNAFFSVFFK